MFIKIYIILVLTFFLLISCTQESSFVEQVNETLLQQHVRGWIHEIPNIGVYSSPRTADLNQDGVKDIIVGAGKLEFQRSDSAVIAFSGATGEILWNVPARDQVFGSACLLDVNKNGVKDVLIGGRSAVLMAINGKSGEIIWEFFESAVEAVEAGTKPSDFGWYNFYNPQIIPDQTGNGIKDILISNGGDVTAPPFSPDRPVGKLMVIDSSNGNLLVEVDMPDGKETYMSPIVSKMHKSDDDWTVIFGTGGETMGGNLYRTTLSELMEGDISNAKKLLSSEEKGFIAPPVLADITQNGYYDIIVNAVEGKVVAINGLNNSLIWENEIENVEAYGSLAVGQFNEDDVPDFFTTFAEGRWPDFDKSVQIMIDGKTGEVEFRDSLGAGQISSPVVADINNDGIDNSIMSINFTRVENQMTIFHNMLVIYDFYNYDIYQVAGANPGFNLASTPWIGDLDDNGMLDIISVHLTNTQNRFAMEGFRIMRLKTNLKVSSEVKWGAYMGSNYDGIYK